MMGLLARRSQTIVRPLHIRAEKKEEKGEGQGGSSVNEKAVSHVRQRSRSQNVADLAIPRHAADVIRGLVCENLSYGDILRKVLVPESDALKGY